MALPAREYHEDTPLAVPTLTFVPVDTGDIHPHAVELYFNSEDEDIFYVYWRGQVYQVVANEGE